MLKKVYISSTYKDLTVYREAIRDMFQYKGLQDEFTLVSMEGYVSENAKRAIDVCLEDVRKADIYILILAKRYGSIVEGTGISYTESEYNEALKVAQNNPLYKIFVFYSNEEIEKEDFNKMPELQNADIQQFYNSALKNSASFIYPFTTPDNLCKQILLTFNYNFKKPTGITDYKDALMLINRNEQSYSFSKSVKKNTNSFYFSSVYENNPNDFLERLYDLEMGGKYRKCRLELAQFNTVNTEKFKEIFIAELSSQWAADVAEYKFDNDNKLFLSIEINSIEINSAIKLDFLKQVLTAFLPSFLTNDGATTTSNRVIFIFYTYLANENAANEKFNAFIQSLITSVNLPGCLNAIDALDDITKTDTWNWLDVFIKSHTFDQDEVVELLQISDNPFKKLRMKEVNRLIKNWLKTNLFNN
ncbi:DUF4062 domain-containing protein [Ferruginibacter sp.]